MHGFDPTHHRASELRGSASVQTAVQQFGTPIERIGLVIDGKRRDVHLKLESYNPGGSIKYRTARGLIQQLEKSGRLRDGGRLIESSSGNLAIGLAMLCQERGYQFTAVVDPMVSQEKIDRIKELGAKTIMVDEPDENDGFLLTRLQLIANLLESDPQLVWTDQYHNPANPDTHYSGIAPEIFDQMEHNIEAVFVAVSTGGTLAGISRYFREYSPDTRIIAVDAKGSVALGGTSAQRKLSGIGSSRRSSFISDRLYDDLIYVGDEEAFAYCRKVEISTGISVGGSSGACIAASGRYLSEHPAIARAICVCADHGDFYASSIFDDQWLEQNKLDAGDKHLGPVNEIVP